MKHQCDEFEELIWDHARTGAELPPEIARHVESCAGCAQAMRDAKRIAPAVFAAGEAANAPDCRSAVMARISGEGRRWVPAWGYACAAIVIAGLVATGMVAYRPHSPTTPTAPIVKNTAPASIPAPPVVVEKTPEPKPVALAHIPHRRIPHRAFSKWHAPRQHSGLMVEAEVQPTPGPRPPTPSPQPRSVAAVYASWPEAGTEASSESYSYVERDSETGETTKGSVKRSGNKVEIYIESTPGGEQPPVKGSIEHESKSNV